MITRSRLLAATLFSTSAAAIVLAQTPLLEPRLGLWEMTSTITMGGAMPGMDTSKMPPEQRARMEAMMKSMTQGQTHVTKSCLKKDDLKDPNFMMRDQGDMKCTQTVTTNTRTALDATVVCTGERSMKGQTHIELPTPTTLKAAMKMESAGRAGGPPTEVSITMSGKWLAADCGKEG